MLAASVMSVPVKSLAAHENHEGQPLRRGEPFAPRAARTFAPGGRGTTKNGYIRSFLMEFYAAGGAAAFCLCSSGMMSVLV